MGLQGLTLEAIERIKVALGDLAINLTLRKRTQVDYTPGTAVSYINSVVAVKGVITKYRFSEIDGTLIKIEDTLIIVFPPDTLEVPKTNDSILNGLVEYRVINNQPVYAGNRIAFNLVQGRPI